MKNMFFFVMLALATAAVADRAEVVSEPVLPRWLSLATDSLGRPSIGYCRIDSLTTGGYKWRITYSQRNGVWQHQVVDSSSAVSHDPAGPPDVSLAFDSDDAPGLFYWKAIHSDSISFGRKTGSSWQVEDLKATYPSWPVLRYDGNIPFLVYSHYNNDSNWIFIGSPGQTSTGWTWDSTGVRDRINNGDRVLDFIWDKTNHAQVLYILIQGSGHKRLVRWLTWDGSNWSGNQPVDSTGTDPREYGVHMALGRSGTVGAVYAHQDNGGSGGPYTLSYSTRTGTGWKTPEIVDTVKMTTAYGSQNCGPALAYDTLDQPHIVYIGDGSSGGWVLMHAYKNNGGWSRVVLDTLRDHPYLYRVETTVDRLNRLHVAYIAGNGSRTLCYLGPSGSTIGETGRPRTEATRLEVVRTEPAGVFEFRLSGFRTAEVGIFNVTGTLAATVHAINGRGRWDARNLPDGLYFARIRDRNDRAVKIVKVAGR